MKVGNKRLGVIKSKAWLEKLAWAYLLIFVLVAVTVTFLPLPFLPNTLDLEHIFQPPFYFAKYTATQPFHWLGTDQLGRDVWVNMLYGGQTALLMSVPAMLLAALLGISLGAMAGYFGNRKLKLSWAGVLAFCTGIFFLIFYLFVTPPVDFADNIFLNNFLAICLPALTTLVISYLLYRVLRLLKFMQRKVYIPVDFLVLKLTEVLQTVPRLLLILGLAAFFNSSFTTVIWLIIFTYWTGLARLVRAETLKITNLPYLEATKALGFSNARIIFKHIIPNALPTILVALTFGITSLMALESTLSFLSIGMPPDMPSWGRAITGIRTNPEAWWLVFFPGMFLSVTVLALQVVCNNIIKWINPRDRSIVNLIEH